MPRAFWGRGTGGKSKPSRFLGLALLALVSAAVVFFLDAPGFLQPLENKAFDGMFVARSWIAPPQARTDSPVVVIGVDDATFADEKFHIPQTLWHNYFSTVILGLADGGAAAVGLDFLLPRALFDDLAPDYSRTWLKAFGMARMKKAPVITGFIQGESQVLPESRYLQLIGMENLGVFNLTSDSDDFIRRQRVFFPAPGETDKGTYSITYLLAKAYKPDITTPGEVVYIDYNTASPPFPRYSFVEVYEKALAGDIEYLKERFAGRIALIGQTDSISQDRHATPLFNIEEGAAQRTAGVEILAHTINTLVAGRYFAETPLAARGALYLMLALAVGLLTLVAAPRWPLPISVPILASAFLAVCVWFFINYRLLPTAGGSAVLLLNLGASFSYRYLVVDREKRMVRNAFSLYLSPQVVDQVLDNPSFLSLGGSRRTMTVFFSDLAGFTSISEAMNPEALVHLLNRYLSLMTREIMKRGGTVDKFEGDAIMAFWGAPLMQEDHALRACLSALEQQRLTAKFREEVKAEGLPELRVRMGINTGEMIVGNMGSEERLDYTVMGDAVNLASRLEGANKGYGTPIMISESTYNMVKERVEARELDLLRVKGKEKPIRVFELLGEAGDLPAEKKAMVQKFEVGLALYRQREFREAKAIFAELLERDPNDGPSRTFLERCVLYESDPPAPDWDGAFTMTGK